jgi:2-phosphosulfolactate phosphatase
LPARIELRHKIHVLTKKEELDSVRVEGQIVVVLDILFATTTMIAALANGAAEVIPVLDEAAARSAARACQAGCFVLAGELHAETLPGFAHPAPLALLEHGVRDKQLIYSTTNGTVALASAQGAKRVYCGALLNAGRLAEHIVSRHARDTLLLVCAGSADNFNLEDFCGAGALVERLAQRLGGTADFSDAARAALAVFRQAQLPRALLECRVGRMMAKRGMAREVEFAARLDACPVVPVLEEGRLRLVAGEPA